MNQHQGNPAQARAKIEAMKRQFEQKKAIAQSISSIKYIDRLKINFCFSEYKIN